ncbi:condensation protein [Streptomyces sp. 549]|uniref:condensation protein n=1 Tax=Streptomyces sp. 549 TaxID=3049076 RepID=UPI0024C31665|nr:condensation protein [Streptomyces sp. 549]MDK1473933.1 condensation protein [Streptomyces sp. 549]
MTTVQRIPFPTVDEISRHCLVEDEPETVHIEIHLPGRIDVDRLREAVRDALDKHPRVLVRQARHRWWDRGYAWEVTAGPDREPVGRPGGTLAQARQRAVSEIPPLTGSPPVRIEVVDPGGPIDPGDPGGPGEGHAAGGSVLVVSVNHTALDGPACLRVLATAAELYGGADNAPAPAPVRAGTSPSSGSAAEPPPAGSNWARPVRIAADRGGARRGPTGGNGMHIAELPLPTRPRGAPYTVNDQLLVATCLTSIRWNEQHGRRAHPVRITMPVDDRPRTAEMPIGNGTRLVEVTFGKEEHRPEDVEQLLRATAARTRAWKAAARPQLGFSGDLLTTPVLPVGLRAAGTRLLRSAAGPWASTTLLSNLGRLAYPLDFGDAGAASAVWVSAPARMPRGVSVTTISVGGRLQLALRWSRHRLDDAAGERFAALFAECLTSTALDGPEAGR